MGKKLINKMPTMYKIIIFIPIILFLVFGNIHGTIWILNDLSIMYMLYISLKVKYINKKSILYTGAFLIICIIVNIIFNGLYLITIIRIYDILKGLIYLKFINFLIVNYKEDVKVFVAQDLFCFFNIYFIINIPVFIIQINAGINRDNIAGLVGFQGTHVVLLVWILIIVLNCYKLKNTLHFTGVFCLVVMEFVLMMIFGVFSDNTAFYFLGPFVLMYCLKSIPKISRIFNFKNVLIILASLIMLSNFIENNEKVKHYIDTKIKVKFEQYTNLHNNEVIPEERVEMIKYGLENGDGIYFGKGIGIRYEIFGVKGKEYYQEPLHINMCDLSALIFEGGLVFAILVIVTYYLFSNNFNCKIKYFNFIFIFLLFWYARFISDERMIFIFSLIQLGLYYFGESKSCENY